MLESDKPPNKTVYWYDFVEESRRDKHCNFHPLNLWIELSKGYWYTFPKHFCQPASIVMSQKNSSLIQQMEAEYLKLHKFGLVRAMSRLRLDSTGRNKSSKMLTYRSCRIRQTTKLRAPEYNKALGKLQDETTTFLCLLVGFRVGWASLVCEFLFFRKDDNAAERKIRYEIRRKRLVEFVLRSEYDEIDELETCVAGMMNRIEKTDQT